MRRGQTRRYHIRSELNLRAETMRSAVGILGSIAPDLLPMNR